MTAYQDRAAGADHGTRNTVNLNVCNNARTNVLNEGDLSRFFEESGYNVCDSITCVSRPGLQRSDKELELFFVLAEAERNVACERNPNALSNGASVRLWCEKLTPQRWGRA